MPTCHSADNDHPKHQILCSPKHLSSHPRHITCYKIFKPIPYISRVNMESGHYSSLSLPPLLLLSLFALILFDKVQGLSRHHRAFAAVEAGDQLEA